MALTPDTITTKPRIAIVFPGQGAQAVGMTAELSEIYPQIRDTFAEASTALGEDLWAICQDEDKLNQDSVYSACAISSEYRYLAYLTRKAD